MAVGKAGRINICDLVDMAVAAIYGEWAIQNLEALPNEDRQATSPAYLQGGVSTTGRKHTARREPVRETLLADLAAGKIIAYLGESGDRIDRYTWTGNNSLFYEQVFFNSGIIPPSSPEHPKNLVEVDVTEANAWVDHQASISLSLMTRMDWTYLECLAWLYTRDPVKVVHLSKPLATDHDRSDFALRLNIYWQAGDAAQLDDSPCPSLSDADSEIINAARAGNLAVTGKQSRHGEREAIPMIGFQDLRFIENPSGEAVLSGPVEWCELSFDRDAVLRLWPSTSVVTKVPAKPGRPAGAGEIKDGELVAEMKELLDSGKVTSVSAAARMVSDRAGGYGKLESRETRLRDKFAKRFPGFSATRQNRPASD